MNINIDTKQLTRIADSLARIAEALDRAVPPVRVRELDSAVTVTRLDNRKTWEIQQKNRKPEGIRPPH